MAVGPVGLVGPVGFMEVIDGDLAELLLYHDTWRGDGVFIKLGWGLELKRVKKGFLSLGERPISWPSRPIVIGLAAIPCIFRV